MMLFPDSNQANNLYPGCFLSTRNTKKSKERRERTDDRERNDTRM